MSETKFHCNSEIEGKRRCETKCDHCREYYKPLDTASPNHADMPSSPSKEVTSQSPGEIPQMSLELSAQSDVAALEYGKHCDHFIGERPYDGSHITEAHEQGQIWMYRKLQEDLRQATIIHEKTGNALQSQLSSIKAERDEYREFQKMAIEERDEARKALRIANNNVKGLTHWWDEAKKDRDLYKKEVLTWKDECNTLGVLLEGKNLENAGLKEALEKIIIHGRHVTERGIEFTHAGKIADETLTKYKKEEPKP